MNGVITPHVPTDHIKSARCYNLEAAAQVVAGVAFPADQRLPETGIDVLSVRLSCTAATVERDGVHPCIAWKVVTNEPDKLCAGMFQG